MNTITTINDLRNVGFDIGAAERFDTIETVTYAYEPYVEVPANVEIELGGSERFTLDGILTFSVAGESVATVTVRTLLSLALGMPVRNAQPATVAPLVSDTAETWPVAFPAPEPTPFAYVPMGDDAAQE